MSDELTTRLEGRIVVLEPLEARHEEGLFVVAAQYPEIWTTDARNERSRGALQALPARFEGILRKHMLMPGIGVRDSAYYSVIDEEWPQVRANLERRLAAAPTLAPTRPAATPPST